MRRLPYKKDGEDWFVAGFLLGFTIGAFFVVWLFVGIKV